MRFFSPKITGIGAGALVLAAAAFFARQDIARIVRPSLSENEPILSGSADREENDVSSDNGETPQTARTDEASPLALPPYRGRDPEEVRPGGDALANLNEDQRNALFSEIRQYGAEVKKDPAAGNWVHLGLLKKNIGDYEGAADAWEYASFLFPGEDTPLFNLGELYRHYLPDFPKSERYFRAAIERKLINAPRAYIGLSDLYFYSYKEKKNLADDVLQEGVAAYPQDASLLRALAGLYERIGETGQAVSLWEQVAVKEPDNEFVRKTLEDLKKKEQ